MKTLQYIYAIFIIALFTSCEDSFEWIYKGQAVHAKDSYLSFTLNVPEGEGATRVNDGNADLEHGTEKEYELYNAYLLLFEQNKTGTDQPTTFCDVFEIYDKTQTVPPGQITHISSRYIIRNFQLWKFVPDTKKKYYGVIIANIDPAAVRVDIVRKTVKFRDPYGNFPDENTFSKDKANPYDDKYAKTSAGAELKDMKNKMMLPMNGINSQGSNFLSINRNGSTYLMMSNSMLFPAGGGVLEAVELTDHIKLEPISSDPNYVQKDWPRFYLERIAAKVQVTTNVTNNRGTYNGYNYELKQWCLANVSPNTFVMRHGDMQWDKLRSKKASISSVNRFTSNTFIESGYTHEEGEVVPDLKRGYFSESTEYLKCTRDSWGKGFKTEYGTSDGIVNPPVAEHFGGNFFAQSWHPFGSIDYCHENTMKVWRMQVKYATHVVVEVEFWKGERPATGNLPDITIGDKTFTNGKAYYILPISHFGDAYTPWKDNEWGGDESKKPLPISPLYPEDVTERYRCELGNILRSYPGCRSFGSDYNNTDDQEGHMSDADGNYLGRWGVVRNTWYQLNISGVNGFGIPENPITDYTVITNDPTPLDYYENNLICTVKVNNWTVRDQSVTLQ